MRSSVAACILVSLLTGASGIVFADTLTDPNAGGNIYAVPKNQGAIDDAVKDPNGTSEGMPNNQDGTSDGAPNSQSGTSDGESDDYDDDDGEQSTRKNSSPKLQIPLGDLLRIIPPLVNQPPAARPDLSFADTAAKFDEATRRVALSFCVVNRSKSKSAASKVSIRDRSTGKVVESPKIEPLSPGDQACRDDLWASVPSGFTGTRWYDLAVDPDNTVKESNEQNNSGQANAEIRPLPDLSIAQATARFDAAARAVALSFCVVNPSRTVAGKANVSVRDRLTGDVVANAAIGSLSAGSRVCRDNLAVGAPAGFNGRRQYVVIVDPNDRIKESNEDNNMSFVAVDIVARPDLALAAAAAEFDAANRRAILSFCVVNRSKVPAKATTVSVRDRSTGEAVASAPMGPVPAGGRTCRNDLPVPVPAGFSGSRRYQLIVDPDDKIAESDEDNNISTAALTILAQPDLAFAESAARFDEAAGRVTISFCVVNHGKGAADNSEVSIRDRSTGDAVGNVAIGPLPGGDRACRDDLPASIPAGFSGARSYDLIADSKGRITESNEDNNTSAATVDISAQPDLVLADSTARFDETARRVTISFCVVNRGKGAADASDVAVRDRLTGDAVGTAAIGTLAAGDRACRDDLPASIPAGFSGPRTYDLIADSKGRITESNEDNNTSAATVDISAQPDLVLAETAARFDDTARRVTISFCVVNSGKEAADGSEVSIRDHLTGDAVGTAAIGALPAGERACRNDLPASIPAGFSGARTYDLTADSKSVIAESDEGNNTATATVDISGQPDFSFTGTAAKFDEAARELVLSFCVVNGGGTASPETRVSIRDPSTGGEVGNPRIAPLDAGRRTCRDGLLMPVPAGFSGTQRYDLAVDPDGKVGESDETNNTDTAEAIVSSQPNLGFAGVSGRLDETAGRVLLSFCVVNSGQASSNDGAVSIRDSAAGGAASDLKIGPLAAGAQNCLNDVAMPALAGSGGARQYELVADAQNTTSESNEQDNTQSVSVPIPDAAARPEDFSTSAGEPGQSWPATVWIVVAAIAGLAILLAGILLIAVRPRGEKRNDTSGPSDSIQFRGRPDPGTQVTQGGSGRIVLPSLQIRGHVDPGHQRIEMRTAAE